MSFEKFAVVAVDHGLFSDYSQDTFIGITYKQESKADKFCNDILKQRKLDYLPK